MPRFRTFLALGLGIAMGCQAPESQSESAEAADAPAQPAAASAEAASGDESDTIYALGLALSRNLAAFDLNAQELEVLLDGVRDGVLGNEPRVALDDYRENIQALAGERHARIAKAEQEASAAFLAAEAAEEGATTSDTGLVKRVITAGEGDKPSVDDTVTVHYHGTLRDGSVFDSSVDRGQPATFPLAGVVECWKEALPTMQVGEKANIVCPAEIAYGDRGAPPRIPPGAALAFEVELLEIVAPPDTSTPAP